MHDLCLINLIVGRGDGEAFLDFLGDQGIKTAHSLPCRGTAGKKLLDLLIIAPCTGNTLGKLAYAITDTAVTMAAKAQLRNGRPVLLAISTNDGLSQSAKNIGALMPVQNVFFVPFRQDDPVGKPSSLVADLEKLPLAAQMALNGHKIECMF